VRKSSFFHAVFIRANIAVNVIGISDVRQKKERLLFAMERGHSVDNMQKLLSPEYIRHILYPVELNCALGRV
jgi:hypothetical protein